MFSDENSNAFSWCLSIKRTQACVEAITPHRKGSSASRENDTFSSDANLVN